MQIQTHIHPQIHKENRVLSKKRHKVSDYIYLKYLGKQHISGGVARRINQLVGMALPFGVILCFRIECGFRNS